MRKRLEGKDLIIVFYSVIMIVLVLLFLSVFRSEKTGQAWTIESDKSVEDFDSLGNPWEEDSVELGEITEEFWNRTFSVAEVDSGSELKIKLEDTEVSGNEGLIWFRLKTNGDLDDSGIMPIFSIGGIALFLGDTDCSPHSSCTPISNGNRLLAGATTAGVGIKRPKTGEIQWKPNEWHEILIEWKKNMDDDGCDSGKSHWINIYVDSFDQSAFGLGQCIEADFPFELTDYLYIMPSMGVLPAGAVDGGATIKSGFSIDDLITSDADIVTDLNGNNIVEIEGVYFSNLDRIMNIDKNPSVGSVVYSDIVDTCKVWNDEDLRGDVTIERLDQNVGIVLGIQGDDVVIESISPADIETRTNFWATCERNDEKHEVEMFLTVGDPVIIDLGIKNDFVIEKNQVSYIYFNLSYLSSEALSPDLSYDVTGDNIVTATVEGSQKRIKIESSNSGGIEDITFTVTDVVGVSVSEQISIEVLVDNEAPVIENCASSDTDCSPEDGNQEIEQGEQVLFEQIIHDDRTATDELTYQWYVDDSLISPGSTYEFTTTGNTPVGSYTIKLDVTDKSVLALSSTKTWVIAVVERTIDQNVTNYNDSDDGPPESNQECGNNILEEGEECDGTDKTACGMYVCQNDCTCYDPPVVVNDSDNNQDDNQDEDPEDDDQDSNQGGQTQQGSNSGTNQGSSNSGQTQQGSTNPLSGKDDKDKEEETDKEEDKKEEIVKLSPQDKLFRTLLWVLGGLLLVPFIIIAIGKISKPKQEQVMEEPIQTKKPEYDHNKLVDTIKWYKSKGSDPNYIYNMLLRMGFKKEQAYKAVSDTFYRKK